MIGGEIVFFKNTHLSIDNKTYKMIGKVVLGKIIKNL